MVDGKNSSEMRSTRHNAARHISLAAGFLVFCLVCWSLFTSLLVTKDGAAYPTEVYDKLPQNSIDVVFIGASTYWDGISPMKLWEEHGITSYVFASSNCPPQVNYLMLQNALKHQNPSVVFLSPQFLVKKQKGDQIPLRVIKSLYYEALSIDKIMAAIHIAKDTRIANGIQGMLPLLAYHDNWKDIKQTNLINSYPDYAMGQRAEYFFHESFDKTVDELIRENATITYEDFTYNKVAVKYYRKIVALCKEKGIDVVLRTMPLYNNNINHKAVKQFAAEEGVRYVNCNDPDILGSIGLENSLDWRDAHHLNWFGSQPFSGWLGKFIDQNYDLKDRRKPTDPAAAAWLGYYSDYYDQFQGIVPGELTPPNMISNGEDQP
jgi:predicted acetyltransferase